MSLLQTINTRLNGVYVALKQAFTNDRLQTDDLDRNQVETYYNGNIRSITPERLKQLLNDADRGDISAMHAMFYEIEEQDPHIAAEITKRKNAVLTLDWSVMPPRDATPAEKKQAEWVHTVLSDISAFEDVMLDCLDAIGHGFAALEIEWTRHDAYFVPKSFNWRAQSWFKIDKQTQELRLIKQGEVDGQPLWENQWIIHKHKTKSGALARSGLHRVLAWTFAFKNYAVNDLAEFLEIYGLPVRVGKYPAGISEGERRNLLNAVASLGHNAAGVMPDNMDIEIKSAVNGQHDPYLAMIEYCERAQSKVILGSTLTSQSDGKSSTNALGKIHNEVRRDLLVSDAKQLAQTLTDQLIYTLLSINFGDIDRNRLPYFQFDVKEVEDLLVIAEFLTKTYDLIDISADWVYEKTGIPKPSKDDVILRSKSASTEVAASTLCGHNHSLNALNMQIARSKNDPDLQKALIAQQSIDNALNALPTKYAQSYDSVVMQVVEALQEAQDYDHAQSILYSLMPELNDKQFTEAMSQAILISDVAGRESVARLKNDN